DELAVKERLITLVDGPAAAPAAPTIPPQPTARPRDWLDDLLDHNAPEPEPVKEPAETAPEPEPDAPKPPAAPKKPKARKTRRNRPRRHDPAAPRSAWDSRPPAPRQSLLDAWDRVPYRLKWLAYHATAAYLGWTVGLVSWATYVTGWIANGHLASPQAVFWYVAGALTLLLHHRTRRMWLPVAWLAAVPAASTVVGVLLYGTPNP
ncbi:MAG: hypothetical protein HOY79_43945, partial [Streptomyces sp.]|nr:hypothetical protein [Streptomyces sp.]